MSRHASSPRAILYAFTANLGIAIAKLAAKVKMRDGISIEEAVASINALEKRIKERFPEIAWCFVEPDVGD